MSTTEGWLENEHSDCGEMTPLPVDRGQARRELAPCQCHRARKWQPGRPRLPHGHAHAGRPCWAACPASRGLPDAWRSHQPGSALTVSTTPHRTPRAPNPASHTAGASAHRAHSFTNEQPRPTSCISFRAELTPLNPPQSPQSRGGAQGSELVCAVPGSAMRRPCGPVPAH